jgi:hypothetical protein
MSHRHTVTALAAVLFLCACTAAMTTSDARTPRHPGAPHIDREYTGTVADWPLFFIRHNFSSQCFETQYCRVRYGGLTHDDEKPTPSIAEAGKYYPGMLTGAVTIGIDNFAGPVEIDWRAKDGTPLQASIDLDAIFKDRLVPIPPGVTRDEIPDEIGIGETTIVIEVVDRTVNVWTRTRIPMKEAQIPGNRYSFNNDDLVRVFSRTY